MTKSHISKQLSYFVVCALIIVALATTALAGIPPEMQEAITKERDLLTKLENYMAQGQTDEAKALIRNDTNLSEALFHELLFDLVDTVIPGNLPISPHSEKIAALIAETLVGQTAREGEAPAELWTKFSNLKAGDKDAFNAEATNPVEAAIGCYIKASEAWASDMETYHELTLKSREASEKVFLALGVANNAGNSGMYFEAQGKLQEALAEYQSALELWKAYEHKFGIATLHHLSGRCNLAANQLEAAESHLKAAIEGYHALNHPNEGYAWQNLGQVYASSKQTDEALKAYQNALELLKKEEDIAYTHYLIGELYLKNENYSEAIEAYKRALELYDRLGDKENVAHLQHLLGACYWGQNQYEEALKAYQASLSYFVETENAEMVEARQRDIASTHYQIGNRHQSNGNYPEAIEAYKRALELYDKLGRKEHVADLQCLLGHCYWEQNHYEEALNAYQVTLSYFVETKIATGGEAIQSDIAAYTHYQIGNHYQSNGNYSEAIEAYKRALELYDRLGRKKDVANMQWYLGDYYRAQKAYEEALNAYQAALSYFVETKIATGGEAIQSDIAYTHYLIGNYHQSNGNYSEAIEAYKRALELYDRLRRKKDVANMQWHLGDYYRAQKAYEEALNAYQAALSYFVETEKHDVAEGIKIIIVDICDQLGRESQSKGDYPKALEYFQQCLSMRKSVYGEEHLLVANSLNSVAGVYESMGEYKEAIPFYTQALEIRRKLLGEEHPDVVTSLNKLADVYRLIGEDEKARALFEVGRKPTLALQIGYSDSVRDVAFSPDGRILATADDNTAKLWDVATGKLLFNLKGHSDDVNALAFSPDGLTLATAGDYTAKLWDVATGKMIFDLKGHSAWVEAVAFSPDRRTLATASGDGTAKLWDVATGKMIFDLIGHSSYVFSVAFSPDGRTLATAGDNTAKLWDVATGKMIFDLIGHLTYVTAVAFSPDGRTLATASYDQTAKLWDIDTGKMIVDLKGHSDRGINIVGVNSVAFSPDGRILATAGAAKLWNVATGKMIFDLKGHSADVNSVAFNPDGRMLATASGDGTAKLWDVATGKMIFDLIGHSGDVTDVAFSPDGRTLATTSGLGAKLWDVATGKMIFDLRGHSFPVMDVAFSPDGRTLATASMDGTAKLWDVATRKMIFDLIGSWPPVTAVAFSPDGRTLATASRDGTAKLWDVATGKMIFNLIGYGSPVTAVAFSPDGRTLATVSWDRTAKLWDIATGKMIFDLIGHSGDVTDVAFSPDGRMLATASADGTTKLWKVETGDARTSNVTPSPSLHSERTERNELWLCTMTSFDDGTWAVVDPEGRFDASNGGDVEGLHWVVGTEPIALSQLKERYYDPGLLAKIMGFNKEPLRDVSELRGVKLYPEVKVEPLKAGDTKITIHLNEQGGGIGKVQVFVNGKEFVADARGPKPDPQAKQATLSVDVAGAPSLAQGKENRISVVAFNAEGYLKSRGLTFAWTPEGTADVSPPELYAIVVGVSDYTGDAIDLRFAAKDAEDMAKALSLGAKRLFGVEKVHLTLLCTTNNPDALPPTKANLRKAFEEARNAKPHDVLVVYLAGHGIALPQGQDTYCYLTQEARSTDLSDPGVREQVSVTSDELQEWLNKVPATKQVMILDTCAAGAAAVKLVEKRDISGDQIRAIDRLKDRTGFHVLMGCASDAVSYEATQYGQGVLTYSLLQGMKGAALRDDEYVDVSKLFQYAADQVPQLARDIGGIQEPLIAAPRGASFDVGLLKKEDKEAIPLAMVKPLILRPALINPDEVGDSLNLTAMLGKRLREESYASVRGEGIKQTVVYVDADELPGAFQPKGTYTVEGEKVKVRLALWRDGQKVTTFEVEGAKDDLAGLVSKTMEAITQAIK